MKDSLFPINFARYLLAMLLVALMSFAILPTNLAVASNSSSDMTWQTSENYHGSFSDWGETLTGWWARQLEKRTEDPVHVEFDGRYIEYCSKSGLIAMDDYCWVILRDNASDNMEVFANAGCEKYRRNSSGIERLGVVTTATDSDFGVVFNAMEFGSRIMQVGSGFVNVTGSALRMAAIVTLIILLVIGIVLIVVFRGKRNRPPAQLPPMGQPGQPYFPQPQYPRKVYIQPPEGEDF